MPIFICENCGCLENTALGHYWSRKHIFFKDISNNGKALCSECTPLEFADGSKAGDGKWHGRFPKEKYDPKIHTYHIINLDEIKLLNISISN